MRDSGRLRLVLALLFLITGTLLIIGVRSGEAGLVTAIRETSLQLTGPVQSTANSLGERLRVIGENFSRIASRDDELEAFRIENEDLKFKLSQIKDLERRERELSRILQLVPPESYKVLPAKVVSVGSSGNYRWTITLDVGSEDGISLNSTVVSGAGIVGSIVQLGESFSVASLIIDPNVKIGVRMEGTAEIGYISGTGAIDKINLQLFDPYAKMQVGAKVLSWGSDTGKPYMPGLAIGRISSVVGSVGQLNRVATVIPSVDISNLEIVGVIRSATRDALRDPLTILDN
jgi:rod shape-determining protein MreC